MSVSIAKMYSKDKSKIWYKIELGKQVGQRIATGIFTYALSINEIQKDQNKEALKILG